MKLFQKQKKKTTKIFEENQTWWEPFWAKVKKNVYRCQQDKYILNYIFCVFFKYILTLHFLVNCIVLSCFTFLCLFSADERLRAAVWYKASLYFLNNALNGPVCFISSCIIYQMLKCAFCGIRSFYILWFESLIIFLPHEVIKIYIL